MVRLDEQFFRALSKYFWDKVTTIFLPHVPPLTPRKIGPNAYCGRVIVHGFYCRGCEFIRLSHASMERLRLPCPVTVDPAINHSFFSHVLMSIVNERPRCRVCRSCRAAVIVVVVSAAVLFDGGNQHRRVKPLGDQVQGSRVDRSPTDSDIPAAGDTRRRAVSPMHLPGRSDRHALYSDHRTHRRQINRL